MANPERTIIWPMGGLNRKFAYQSQAPYTTWACENVRSVGMSTKQVRGGSRPGLVRTCQSCQLGGGSRINMLGQVREVDPSGVGEWTDQFPQNYVCPLPSPWTSLSYWSLQLAGENGIAFLPRPVIPNQAAGVVRDALDISTTADYVLYANLNDGGQLMLFFQLDDTTPNPFEQGVIFRLLATLQPTGVFTCRILVQRFSGGAVTHTSAGAEFQAFSPLELSVLVDHTSPLYVGKVNGLDTGSVTVDYVPFVNSTRFGFALQNGVFFDGSPCLASSSFFRITYTDSSGLLYNRNRLVAGSGGNIYYELPNSAMTQASDVYTIEDGNFLQCAEHYGSIYIADFSVTDPLKTGTDGTVDATGLIFDDGGTVWDTLFGTAANAKSHVVEIDVSGQGIYLPYRIGAATSSTITLLDAAPEGSDYSFRIRRSPKYYRPDSTTGIWWPSLDDGYVPIGCPVVCTWQDRLVLAGDRYAPHVWYMSKMGDPFDWDYSGSDAQSATSGPATNCDAGSLPGPITALIPITADYLVIAEATRLWVMRGNPMLGASLDNMSQTVGVIHRAAWCVTPEGVVVFLSYGGLYQVVPSERPSAEPISRNLLPNELLNVDPHNFDVFLVFDVERNGILISVVPRGTGSGSHFWFDWEGKSFWFDRYADDDFMPRSAVSYNADSVVRSGPVFGGADGRLRRFQPGGHFDDGVLFSSYCDLGPLMLGRRTREIGMVEGLDPTLGEELGDVSWSVRTGRSAEKAVRSTARVSGVFKNGLIKIARPEVSGQSAVIRIGNVGGIPWEFENLVLISRPIGPRK